MPLADSEPSGLRVAATAEVWPIAGRFVIARGAKTEAHVVVATVSDGRLVGRGECVPYARYGETVDGVLALVRALDGRLPADRQALRALMPPGAARNALDCALWDLEAKATGRTPAAIAGLQPVAPLTTCYTISLGAPEEMAAQARTVPQLPLLKLKLGGAGDDARMAAVRAARPDARLVADANESWTADLLLPLLDAAAAAGLELVEQPLPAGADAALAGLSRRVPVCADESVHALADLAPLALRYDAVNIKLDKAGGLTEALEMAAEARRLGLGIMAGCMVATSLSMAPALLLAQLADWVDLDGPLLLARDREHGLAIARGVVPPPDPRLWG